MPLANDSDEGVPADWADSFFDRTYIEVFDRLGKYVSTSADVENLIELAQLKKQTRVLDVPCGWGRHAAAMAQRGFEVTAVDSSAAQIAYGREQFPDVDFYERDMRDVPQGPYDAVLNLWTSFGVLGSDEDDRDLLKHWAANTSPNGKLVMELTTFEYAEASNRADNELVTHKSVTTNGVTEEAEIDWESRISVNRYTYGDWSELCRSRLYDRQELEALLKLAGYKDIAMYGGFDGRDVSNDGRTVIVASLS